MWLLSNRANLESLMAAPAAQARKQQSQDRRPRTDPSITGKYELMGIISHIGKNTGSGHYVCHVKKDGRWIFYNDQKVVLSRKPPVQHGFLYLYRAVRSGDE